jgi:hypothetical protein
MIDNVAFGVVNLIDTATITASSNNAQFPVSNLKDVRRTKVYRATTNTATINFDFGEAKKVGVVAVVSSGVNGKAFEFESCLFEMSTTNDFAVKTFTQVLDLSDQFGFGLVEVPDIESRYARLVLTRTTGEVELSKVFIGEYLTLGVQGFEYPLGFVDKNNASTQKNRLGQRFIDVVNKQKELSGSISTLTRDEMDDVFSILDEVSNIKPLWVIFPEGNITNDNKRISGYYYIDAEPPLSFDRGNYWSLNLTLEEAT